MKPNKWQALVMLWAFAIGVALSYQPPAINPVEIVTLGPIVISDSSGLSWQRGTIAAGHSIYTVSSKASPAEYGDIVLTLYDVQTHRVAPIESRLVEPSK